MYDCDMKDAKRASLMELIKQMQQLMAEGKGEKPQDIGEKMAEVEEDVMSAPEVAEADEDEESSEKKAFMKGSRPAPKGKAIGIVSVISAKKPPMMSKAKKYG